MSLDKIVLVVATFLDPRFKDIYPFIPDADQPKIFDYTLTLMQEIAGNQTLAGNNDVEGNNNNELSSMPDEEYDAFAEVRMKTGGGVARNLTLEHTKFNCQAELNRYQSIPQICTKHDPLSDRRSFARSRRSRR